MRLTENADGSELVYDVVKNENTEKGSEFRKTFIANVSAFAFRMFCAK